MHVHLPKPMHGWREFLGEVGIIVIGVLVALGAEQIVETLHQRREGADAEQRIRAELTESTGNAVERLLIGPCLTERIASISKQLAAGTTEWHAMLIAPYPGRPTALREIYHMPSRDWVNDAYREALAKGDLNSLTAERRGLIAELYSQTDELGQLNQKEQELTTALAPLQFNRPLSDPERKAMIATMARLDSTNGLIILIAGQIFETLHSLGYQTSTRELFAGRGGPKVELKGLRARYGNCVNSGAFKQYEDIAIRGAHAG